MGFVFPTVGNGLDRSKNRPGYGEVARAKRVTEGQVTSKSTGGRGNPPLRLDRQTPNCHPARSEGSPIAQNKPERNEILHRTAQNDKWAGEHSSPLRVGNNLRVVPQNHIKIDGRAWKPAPTVGETNPKLSSCAKRRISNRTK